MVCFERLAWMEERFGGRRVLLREKFAGLWWR